jgi:tetratricopeptide (TPR) repeat protein
MKALRFLAGVFFFTVVIQGLVSAAPVDYWFERANALYEQQNYDSAAAYYERILSSGTNNGAVCFNLGNTYFRLKKIGLAMLFFERARKLSPNDPDVIANIKFAQSAIVDRLPMPDRSFFETVLVRLHNLFSLNVQLWLIFIFLLLLGVFFSIGLFARPNIRLWLMYISSLVVLVGACMGISAGIKVYASEKIQYAIVLAPSVDAKNQPNGNKVLFTVHEGTKFRVRKQLGEWSLVSLPTGVSGWVVASSLGGI